MMKGTKRKGRGSEGEEAKSSKKCLACLLVLLFVIGTLIAPAAVAKGDGGAIEKINAKLEAIDEDPIINSFLYNRMSEYNEEEGIEAVKIVVMKGHWWSGYKVVKTFYVVRNDTASGIDIIDDYDDDLWTFYPKIGHTIAALDVLLEHELTVRNVIHMGIRAILVDKDNNVPGIMEIINNSPWASGYLPDWAKDFLDRFESHH